MRFHLALLFGLLPFCFVQAQLEIAGKVLDSASLEPVRFVSVILKGSNLGSETDDEGNFSFEIDKSSNPVILFKMIGYGIKELSLKELELQNTVYLVKQEHELDEVVLQPVNAYELIKQVTFNVPKNYYAEPIGQEVFFRQTMYTNGQLNILEEAHFDIINSFRKSKLPKNVSIHKGRGFIDLDEYADLGKIIANNLDDDSINLKETAEILLAFNPNKNALTEDNKSLFSDEAYKFYDIVYQGIAEKYGHTCHVVAFDQKEGLKKTLFKGVVYIDTSSLAITDFTAGLSPEGLDFQKFLPLKIRMLIKLAGFKIVIKDISVAGRYEYYDGFWVIKNAGFQLKGSISRGKGTVLNGALNLNYYVDHQYPKSSFYNLSNGYANIASDINAFKDVNFWKGQDVFIPNWNAYIQKLLDEKITDQ